MASLELDREKVVVLNQVYENGLTAPTEDTGQMSVALRVPLRLHQRRMMEGMIRYRERMTTGVMVSPSRVMNGKMGIVGDPPGTGKTLTVLAYLSATYQAPIPRMSNELTPHSSRYFYTHEVCTVPADAVSVNLIIVPHHLYPQWCDEIEQHTHLPYVAMESRRVMKGTDAVVNQLVEKIKRSAFILTTHTCYKWVDQFAQQHHLRWNNVFLDEASSIRLEPSDPFLSFQFLWLITNNWIPLLFKHPIFRAQQLLAAYDTDRYGPLHPELYAWLSHDPEMLLDTQLTSSTFLKEYVSFHHPLRGLLVLRTSDESMYRSMALPPIQYRTLHCRPNITLQSLMTYYLSRYREPRVLSKDIPRLFQALHVEHREEPMEAWIETQPAEKRARILRKMDEMECAICLEPCEYPTLSLCCSHLYCGKCILTNAMMSHKCPMCRTPLPLTQLICMTPLSTDDRIGSLSKTDTFLQLLQQTLQPATSNAVTTTITTSSAAALRPQFIVYSRHDNTYYQLYEEMERMGIKAERLESQLFPMLKTIERYKKGETQVLFLSKVDILRGLSLSNTTHLIFYQGMPSAYYEQKQILLHAAQRLKRSTPLQVLHLDSEIEV